ncbi:hypothetical protein INR49_017901 [Caranx melampygus]|nr:hypothetical protein INR49_017901 [Caranx melampygus]
MCAVRAAEVPAPVRPQPPLRGPAKLSRVPPPSRAHPRHSGRCLGRRAAACLGLPSKPDKARHVTWTGAAIKDDWLLNPGNKEVGSFTDNGILHSSEPVKDHSPGRVHNTSTDGEGQPQLPNGLEQLGHDSDLQMPVTSTGHDVQHMKYLPHCACAPG